MKILSSILILLILSLSLMPCEDTLATDHVNTGMHIHDKASQTGHSGGGGCSPFCYCSCCHTHIISFTYHITHFIPVTTMYANTYTPGFTSTFNFSVWHPPQLSA